MFIRTTATMMVLLLASVYAAAATELGHPTALLTCESDIHALCEDVFPDVKRVAACLVDKRSKLTTACAEQLAHPDGDDEPEPD